MALKLSNSDLNEIKQFTKMVVDGSDSLCKEPLSIDVCDPFMLKVMQNLRIDGKWDSASASPSFVSSGSELDTKSIYKESLKSDSGYDSPRVVKKLSRWVEMNEELLHKDAKKFLKLSGKQSKSPKEVGNNRIVLCAFREFLSSSIEEEDCEDFNIMLQGVMKPKDEITRCLLTLCDAIGMYMKQHSATLRDVFKQSQGSFDKFDCDLKSIVHNGRTIEEKVSKLIAVLYQDLKLDQAASMVHGLQVICQERGICLDYSEAGADDLKRATDWFNYQGKEFKKYASVNNMNSLVKTIHILCMTLKSFTACMWTLSKIIEIRKA